MRHVIRHLDLAIVTYLALPLVLFIGGSFRLLFALGLLLLLGIALVPLYRSVIRLPLRGQLAARGALIVIVLSLVWSVLGGSGHLVHAELDWMKHDAIYADLARYGWPTTYGESADGSIVMRYYTAYYMVPAVLSKLVGHHNLCMQLWTALGVALFGLRLVLAMRSLRQVVLIFGLFVVFGGMDLVGWLFMQPFDRLLVANQQIDGWNSLQHLTRLTMIQYSNSSTLLFWVPQHALSAWLAISLVVDRDDDDFTLGTVGLLLVVSFWSVFAALGLVPFVVLRWLRRFRRDTWRAVINPYVLAGLALTGLTGVFMLAGNGGNLHGFVWQINPAGTAFRRLLLFYAIEVLPLLLALRVVGVRFDMNLKIATGVLLALPIYYFGTYGDLTMRASIPALLVLFLGLRRLISDQGAHALWTRRAVPLLAVLSIGAYTVVPQLVLISQRDADRHPQIHERDIPTLLADTAPDVPPSQYMATQPAWIERALRDQQPLYDIQPLDATSDASGWMLKAETPDAVLRGDALGRATFIPDSNGEVQALTDLELAPGLYRVRLQADVRSNDDHLRASFGIGGGSHRMATFDVDGGKTSLDYFIRQFDAEPKKMWLDVKGLTGRDASITVTELTVERWTETPVASDRRPDVKPPA